MIGFGVQMPARASLRCGLLVDVLTDRGSIGSLSAMTCSLTMSCGAAQADVRGPNVAGGLQTRDWPRTRPVRIDRPRWSAASPRRAARSRRGLDSPGRPPLPLAACDPQADQNTRSGSRRCTAALVGDLRAPRAWCEGELAAWRSTDGRRARCQRPPTRPGCCTGSAVRTGSGRGAGSWPARRGRAPSGSSTPASRRRVLPASARTIRPSRAWPHACVPPDPPAPTASRPPASAPPPAFR